MFKKNNGYKSLSIYFGITFGVWWLGIIGLTIFKTQLTPYIGQLSPVHPIVIFFTYLPSIASLLIYYQEGKCSAVKNLFLKFIPRRQDLFVFPMLFIMVAVFALFLRFGSILLNFSVPEITDNISQMFTKAFMVLLKETALIGGVLGWVGYLLPFLQAKTKNNVLSGLLTGFLFGLWVIPMPFLLGAKVSVSYTLYVIQLMTFFIFISYIFNFTKGTLIFYIFTFWLVATGSHIQLYYFNTTIQLMQILFFIMASVIAHIIFKKINIKPTLQQYPDFIYSR